MSAEEYYLSKKWGNPKWDRKIPTNFCKSEMFDFAESYAREYHAKEMERKLEEAENEIESNFPISSAMSNRLQEQFMDEKRGSQWLLTHLKEQKQDKG
tara:strand:+ start:1785 stop:2078 length:294 start_codon:yes stop_codon:yes gene_type:complete